MIDTRGGKSEFQESFLPHKPVRLESNLISGVKFRNKHTQGYRNGRGGRCPTSVADRQSRRICPDAETRGSMDIVCLFVILIGIGSE